MWRLGGCLLLALCLILSGCERQPPAQRQLDDYLQRLARVLDQDWQPFDHNSLSQYRMPDRRLRMQALDEQRMGLFTLLIQTRHCQSLQHLISERNSSLGRVMPSSHLLSHDAALLHEIDACLLQIADNPDHDAMREQLIELAAIKRRELPKVFWNALNGSSEYEYYLRFADQPLPPSAEPLGDHAAVSALEQLAYIGSSLPEQLPPERAQIDPLFDALRRSKHGSELIHSLALTRHSLKQATRMLTSEGTALLCPQGAVTQRARILHNVFRNIYAADIQPYLAQIQRLGQPWQSALADLQQVPGQTQAGAAYLASLQGTETALWDSYQASLQAHNNAWLEVLGRCGMQPGQASNPD
ncbi:DUF3080 family protein [Halopseudomonas salegens]|uniref:DUF3080 domain-containing protein n=1 Tax=Halopseudomonas salegens TaxID=1434072 RepID=A0A1H2F313_9GAMM|nr:DUF3080 family protein [Halopseudomonas salegens]SDU01653.1 Protein of unknown function [Halopseudomonas salegens]